MATVKIDPEYFSIIDKIKELSQDNYYEFVFRHSMDFYRQRIRMVGATGFRKVLDLGQGYGQWSVALSEMNDEVVAIDHSEYMCDTAEFLAEHYDCSNISVKKASIYDLDDIFAEGEFDFIWCWGVIMFVDRDKALPSINRILSSDGRLLLGAVNTPKRWAYKAEKGRRDNLENPAFYDYCDAGEKGLFSDKGMNAYSTSFAINQKILAPYNFELIDVKYDGCIDLEGNSLELKFEDLPKLEDENVELLIKKKKTENQSMSNASSKTGTKDYKTFRKFSWPFNKKKPIKEWNANAQLGKLAAKNAVPIRAFPWPYRAALSISNDCDFLTIESMLSLHQLFASPVSVGGLDLDLSDSFFFYQNGSSYPTYSYFDGLSFTPSKAAPAMREMIKTGHLDTMHALGDFENGGFGRHFAQYALEELDKHGLSVPIWSNHGGFGNIQNIGTEEFFYHHSGDDLNRPFYILDILEDIGVRYFWLDAYLCNQIGLSVWNEIPKDAERKVPRQRAKQNASKLWSTFNPKWSFDRTNAMSIAKTRAGNALQLFSRYHPFLPESDANINPSNTELPNGFRPGPNIGRIADSLTEELLDKLVDIGGSCILYQHFSTLAHLPKRTHMTASLEFHPNNLDALHRLSREQHNGRIWVPSLSTHLQYLTMINTTDVAVREQDSLVVIEVKPKRGYSLATLDGLTVEVPKNTRKAVFKLPGGIEHQASLVGNEGESCNFAMLPIKSLEMIDWLALAKEAGVQLPETPQVTLLDGSKPVGLTMPDSIL